MKRIALSALELAAIAAGALGAVLIYFSEWVDNVVRHSRGSE